MKVCFKCHQEKPLDDFYAHSEMADGHLNKCKKCTRRDAHEHRWADVEKERERDRTRARRPSGEYSKKYRKENPVKHSAQSKLSRALMSGRIEKPSTCSVCFKSGVRIEGHHWNYYKPLDVLWVCTQCHRNIHRWGESGRPETVNGEMEVAV